MRLYNPLAIKEPPYHLTEGKNMNIPTSSLYNQKIAKKNKFRYGFVFLFIVSVGLNVFYLFFDRETSFLVESLQKNSEDSSKTSLIELSKVLPQETSQPTNLGVINPVSLTDSQERNNDSNVIHSLNFTIKNSKRLIKK